MLSGGASGGEVGLRKKEDRKEATETICALDVEKHGTGTPPSQGSLCLCHGLISSKTIELPYPPVKEPR